MILEGPVGIYAVYCLINFGQNIFKVNFESKTNRKGFWAERSLKRMLLNVIMLLIDEEPFLTFY